MVTALYFRLIEASGIAQREGMGNDVGSVVVEMKQSYCDKNLK